MFERLLVVSALLALACSPPEAIELGAQPLSGDARAPSELSPAEAEAFGLAGPDAAGPGCGTSEEDQLLLDEGLGDSAGDCPLCGERPVIVLNVTFQGMAPLCTSAQVRASMDHASEIYRESSNGETWLGTEHVNVDIPGCDPETGCVPIPSDPTPDFWSIHRRAVAAARDQGVDFDRFDYIVMAFEQVPYYLGAATWGGMARGYPDGATTRSVADVYYCEQTRIYGHEVGHLMGFGHSGGYPLVSCPDGRDPEECFWGYGDQSDPMGAFSISTFNAWQRVRKEWITEDQIELVDSPTTLVLNAVNQPVAGRKMAVIVRDNSPFATPLYDDHLVVSYRSTVGLDSFLHPVYQNRTSVHTGLNFPTGRANLYKVAGTGSKAWDWRSGWVVKQVFANDAVAIVRFDNGCFATPPVIEIEPRLAPLLSGRSYTVRVRNEESYVCPSTSYTLTFASEQPELAGTFREASLTVEPGSFAETTLTVRETTPLPAGDYGFEVSAQGAPYIAEQGSSETGTYRARQIAIDPSTEVISTEIEVTEVEPAGDPSTEIGPGPGEP